MPGHSRGQLAGAGRRFAGESWQDAGLAWSDVSDAITALADKARGVGNVFAAAVPDAVAHPIDTAEANAKEALGRVQAAAAAKVQTQVDEAKKKAVPYVIAGGLLLAVVVYLAARGGSRRRA